MTMVNTVYHDRNKRIAIVPQLVKICVKCGGYTYFRPSDNRVVCISCKSAETAEIWEHQVGTFRAGLAEREHELALVLVGRLLPQIDELRELLNVVADIDPVLESTINAQSLRE